MKGFTVFVLIFALSSCVSEGSYFQLDELRRMVRERRPAQELVDRHGPPAAQYPDEIFTRENNIAKARQPELVTTVVDEAVFFGLDSEHPDNFDYNEEKPFARARFLGGTEGKAKASEDQSYPEQIEPHLSDTFTVNDCEGKVQALKYHARRNDPNGYVETQYTMLFVDQNWRVCGFQVRSHFAAR
jgi:hypothetical protein